MPNPVSILGGGGAAAAPAGVGGFDRILSLDFDESADADLSATGSASITYTDANGAQTFALVTVTKASGGNQTIGAAYGGWKPSNVYATNWRLDLTAFPGVDLSAYSRVIALVEISARDVGQTQTVQFGNTTSNAYVLLLFAATAGYVRADGDGIGYNQSRTRPGIGISASRQLMLLGPKCSIHIVGADSSPLADDPPTYADVTPAAGPAVDWGSYGTDADIFNGATDFFSTWSDGGTVITIAKIHFLAPTDEIV